MFEKYSKNLPAKNLYYKISKNFIKFPDFILLKTY